MWGKVQGGPNALSGTNGFEGEGGNNRLRLNLFTKLLWLVQLCHPVISVTLVSLTRCRVEGGGSCLGGIDGMNRWRSGGRGSEGADVMGAGNRWRSRSQGGGRRSYPYQRCIQIQMCWPVLKHCCCQIHLRMMEPTIRGGNL